MQPIAIIHTPFPEKFSIPRQPGLAPSVRATIELTGDYNHNASIKGIEQHSHLWLLFQFHQHVDKQWQEQVRPPRLGGNQSLGVFATRSPFRPNNLGLSVVKLLAVESEPNTRLVVSGTDLLDKTPIVDIKPYVPYVDCINEASSDFAGTKPAQLQVIFAPQAKQQLQQFCRQVPELEAVIREVLSQDPRPAYQKQQPQRQYASKLFDYDIHWHVEDQQLIVEEIRPLAP
ncbi:tRNA (N6-threonylcarbamoyladenosine(37)-N6)-methyltransferase TrmO [Idiomarina seosinensis]|uniref:tRNA (N6-threonylcarbamoyladenosine(37)-N6)-methyltransferase TrmO n=1 Tax=Idiomarina seosinensis TaxID=281739 RepID=UPI00384AE964